MSINTIKLTEDDVNRRQKLTKLFIDGKITPDQARELKQILENERYMAMEDGDFNALYSILSWIKEVDYFLTKKVNIFISYNIPESISLSEQAEVKKIDAPK